MVLMPFYIMQLLYGEHRPAELFKGILHKVNQRGGGCRQVSESIKQSVIQLLNGENLESR